MGFSMMAQHLSDLGVAAPAAIARVLLGSRADAKAALLASIGAKTSILFGSLAFAVMMGQLARTTAKTAEWDTAIIISAAFLGQDGAMWLLKAMKRWLSKYEND